MNRVALSAILLSVLSRAAALSAEERALTDTERGFWAFLPPKEPLLPSVRDASWSLSPIDRFILAGLEAKRLGPAPPAEGRVLARRAAFDLTGLPPDPDLLERFLADDSADAFARLVEELLASPRYGERWGRHWLDVARYADSNGFDENLAFGSAHRYRDYVIAAFNCDKPYDRFVREQIAGDMLPADGEEGPSHLVATGFLSLGGKMLAEDDPVKMEMDIVDEQVDTLGRVFLAMTLGCARCHEHKYDPFSLEDYYGLAGIFKSTKTMDSFKVVARWHERPIGSKEEIERRSAIEKEIASKRAQADAKAEAAKKRMVDDAGSRGAEYAALASALQRRAARIASLKPAVEGAGTSRRDGVIIVEAEKYSRGNVIQDFTVYGSPIGVIYNRGELPNVAEYDVAVPEEGKYQLDLRYAAAELRPVLVFVNGLLVSASAAGRVTGSWTPEGQSWEVVEVASFGAGRNTIRLERAGPFPHFDKLALARRGPDGAPDDAVDLERAPGLNGELLRLWVKSIERSATPTPESFAAFLADPQGPLATPAVLDRCLPASDSAAIRELREAADGIQKSLPIVPDAMAVAEGSVQDLRVHVRGSHWELGDVVPRRLPRIFARADSPGVGGPASGRLALADWLSRTENPLTARVMVNRIWRWHFGAGLVRTPDNFGRLGERPTHPELLDWLAIRFVESGWSVKAMHRLILSSAAYRMSGRHDETAATADPENRLRWRFDRRRLEAEAIRDSLLAVSGGLDLAMGGTLLATKNREYVATTVSTNATTYTSPRRSVYLPVVRSALYEVFQAFDFADPSTPNGDRDATTVAPQALFLMNSDLARSSSRRFAERLLIERIDVDERIEQAYRLAFGRPPIEIERAEAREFLDRYAKALDASLNVSLNEPERNLRMWEGFCRSLFSASEFIHVD